MQTVKMYGIVREDTAQPNHNQALEELAILGFTIVENVLTEEELEISRARLDAVYRQQEEELGRDYLAGINELNLARCPLAYDEFFLTLATKETILNIAQQAIGGQYVLLHLQNGIINMPHEEHHQSSWHRDLPYQEFVTSRPLAVSALFCIDEFSVETGGTFVLPHSHRVEKMPSLEYVQQHQTPVTAAAGSVIVFDSMLFHRAGYNTSGRIRRGINHMYVTPILKQQIDLPALLQGKYSDDPYLKKLLGYESDVPSSVIEYRQRRHLKLHPASPGQINGHAMA